MASSGLIFDRFGFLRAGERGAFGSDNGIRRTGRATLIRRGQCLELHSIKIVQQLDLLDSISAHDACPQTTFGCPDQPLVVHVGPIPTACIRREFAASQPISAPTILRWPSRSSPVVLHIATARQDPTRLAELPGFLGHPDLPSHPSRSSPDCSETTHPRCTWDSRRPLSNKVYATQPSNPELVTWS